MIEWHKRGRGDGDVREYDSEGRRDELPSDWMEVNVVEGEKLKVWSLWAMMEQNTDVREREKGRKGGLWVTAKEEVDDNEGQRDENWTIGSVRS